MAIFHLIVKGKVQGVGFRAKVERCAKARGVKGCVKNLPDGTVEIYAELSADQVDGFVQRLKEGKSLGKIEHISVEESRLHKEFSDFEIIF